MENDLKAALRQVFSDVADDLGVVEPNSAISGDLFEEFQLRSGFSYGARRRRQVALLAAGAAATVAVVGSVAGLANRESKPEGQGVAPAERVSLDDVVQSEPDFDGQSDGQPGCAPPSPRSGNEYLGSPDEIDAHALLISRAGPVASDELHFVWRMKGTGPLEVLGVSPSGATIDPVVGLESHASSNFERPGEEWMSVYELPEPGCWHFQLTRSDTRADFWIEIDD